MSIDMRSACIVVDVLRIFDSIHNHFLETNLFVVAAFHIGYGVARNVRATRLYVVETYPGAWPILK